MRFKPVCCHKIRRNSHFSTHVRFEMFNPNLLARIGINKTSFDLKMTIILTASELLRHGRKNPPRLKIFVPQPFRVNIGGGV